MKTLLLTVIASLLLAGCGGSSVRWYKAGAGQAEFDRDAQECRVVAEEYGKQATVTGRRADPEAAAKAYNSCLFAKGWGHTPPSGVSGPTEEQQDAGVEPLGRVDEQGSIVAFDRTFKVPEGFELIGQTLRADGSMVSQTFSFQGQGPTYMNLVLQKSRILSFESVEYPVNEPFFLYDRGSGEDPDRLRWSGFAGEIRRIMVGGVGAYLRIDDHRRVAFVITRSLSPASADVPEGLRLTESQNQAMEDLLMQWVEWLEGVG